MHVVFHHVINFVVMQIITSLILKRLYKALVDMKITSVLAHVTFSSTNRTLRSVILNQNAFQTKCFVIMISQNLPKLMISNALELIKSATVLINVLMVLMKLGQIVFTRIVIPVQQTWLHAQQNENASTQHLSVTERSIAKLNLITTIWKWYF